MANKLTKEVSLDVSTNTALTPSEELTLSQHEQIIYKGKETFLAVGKALSAIKELQLYRSDHKTFEAYCREKWGFSSRQADRLIGAGSVVENLKQDQLVNSGSVAIPENEAQARPLAVLPPPKQIEAARAVAAKTNKPTTKDFKEAANEVEEDIPRIKSYDSKNEGIVRSPEKTPSTGSMQILIEDIDEVETMVKHDKPKEAVLAKLKKIADLATNINNGGRVC